MTDGNFVLFADGQQVVLSTQIDQVRFLLVSGKPIGEPVALYGPIVMNTQEELQTPAGCTDQANDRRSAGAAIIQARSSPTYSRRRLPTQNICLLHTGITWVAARLQGSFCRI